MSIKKAAVAASVGVLLAVGGSIATTEPASATVYSGTIDCGGLNVEGMWINQSGNSGWASWSYLSLGRANWSYNFNGNQYTVAIGCGGSPSGWTTTNYSTAGVYPWTGANWYCNTFERTCQLG